MLKIMSMPMLLTGLVLVLFLSPTAQAQISAAELDQLSRDIQPQVVEWRRWFHQNPELGNREFNTAKKITEILTGMGLEPQTGIAHTGIVAIIKGGLPGPLVAIRTDMDALPVTEVTGLPFASTVTSEYNGKPTGVMHACGHDSHMAMVLGAAEVLLAVKDRLPGSVMLIFQPAEESPPPGEEGGAQLMLKEGIWTENKPQAIFGLHVGLGQPSGVLAVRSGPAMAAVDSFTLTVKGKQTHGAAPWAGVDPIVVSAQIILGLQTIASRQVDVTLAPSIVTVGRINGGIRNNIIPDSVEMEGTIRSFDPAMREQIHMRIERTARGIAQSAGADIAFEITDGYPATVNNEALTARMMPTLQRVAGEGRLLTASPVTGAEDFSYFANETPGLFVFLSNNAPDAEVATAPSNHSPLFDMYEPSMETGVRMFSNLVVDYLQGN